MPMVMNGSDNKIYNTGISELEMLKEVNIAGR